MGNESDEIRPLHLDTLQAMYASWRGKQTDKWDSYLAVYDEIFADLRSDPVRLLEIGVQNGGSLDVWARYFVNARCCVGCDIDASCGNLVYDNDAVKVVIGDITREATRKRIFSLSDNYDIIIDDGSHTSEAIITTFVNCFPRLSQGGIYVIEDLHCSYWGEFGGGLYHDRSAISFLKLLIDVLNYEHWGVALDRADVIRRIFGLAVDAELLEYIHSVEFRNSVCIIRKQAVAENTLGLRRVVGDEAFMDLRFASGMRAQDAVPDQQSNPASYPPTASVAELLLRELEGARVNDMQTRESMTKLTQERNAIADTTTQRTKRIEQLEGELSALRGSRSWRLTHPLRVVYAKGCRSRALVGQVLGAVQARGGWRPTCRKVWSLYRERGLLGSVRRVRATLALRALMGTSADPEASARSIFERQQSELLRPEMISDVRRFARKPLISIIMPVYDTPIDCLKKAIESLQSQVYTEWELCVVDDCSPTDAQRDLLRRMAATDHRIRLRFRNENGGISAASNDALGLATGEFVALLDHDDELTPDALYWVVREINRPDSVTPDFIYTDECKLDESVGRRLFHFVFKPDWSPEILFNGMVTGHLTVYRRQLVDRVGGFREEYDYSQDYDLALRVSEVAECIVHVERILYLWRAIDGSAAKGGKAFARHANIAALDDALKRRGINATTVALMHANHVRMAPSLPFKRVSIVIPSDNLAVVSVATSAILTTTAYVNFEILAVCNSSVLEGLRSRFPSESRLRLIAYDQPYNFSDKCNVGADNSSGDILVFFNDDVRPLHRDWLERLVGYLDLPGVGAVSPKLLYEDGTIQYAGMVSGAPGLCGTAYHHVPAEASDPFLSMHRFVRDVSIVSGACVAIDRRVFASVGGFDSVNTPDGHSDVDISFKLRESGLRCVYTPYAELHHIGNHSWGGKKSKSRADMYLLNRWGKFISSDPYFTRSMRAVLYRDFTFDYRIFAEHVQFRQQIGGKYVLLVSHELSLTGAPRMLLLAAKAINDAGGFAVIVSPSDGPLHDEIVEAGVALIIDASISSGHFLFKKFAHNFDAVIVNTVVLSGVVSYLLKDADIQVIWWLHESQQLADEMRHLDAKQFSAARIVCVSHYAAGYLPHGFEAEVVHNGIPNSPGVADRGGRSDLFTLLVAGTIEPRKGQDIFVQAALALPENIRSRCRFLLSGKCSEAYPGYCMELLSRISNNLDGGSYLGLLSHEEQLQVIRGADAVVCPSRDDPFSIVVVEAAMLGTPAICSNNVGAVEVFDDESIITFESGNVDALKARIMTAYADREQLRGLGAAARLKFEESLAMGRFEKDILALVGMQTEFA